ncbi:MAG: prolyl oligopeptidase family serine peptidase [Blastocatellia bacterium]|nr:prolyl oligopeptidase family serine peptidase [Blastocatellia bacterium]
MKPKSMIRVTMGPFFTILLAAVFCTSILAQDQGQILRMSVMFRTIKNTVKMSEETRKEVEALEANARAANNDKKFDEALKHFSHGLALMRNQPWTPLTALSAALQAKASALILDPGAALQVTLSRQFTPDEALGGALDATLEIKNAKQGLAKTLLTLRNAPSDFARPLALEAALPDLADGDYQLALTLTPKSGAPIVKSMPIRIARGMTAQARELKTRAAAVAGALREKKQDALLVMMPGVEYAASMIDLINAGQIGLNADLKTALTNANASLDLLARGEHPLRAKRGDVHWAYRSKVDDTLQPYRFFVPSNYDAAKKWPLVIALHGMGGDENSFFMAYDNGVIRRIAESRGYIVACPKGRQPTSMYMGPAETDVMDVLAEVKREFSIDEDRVYLTGHSMGGYGTWSVAANHPAEFAALAPFAGGGTPFTTPKLRGIVHVPWIVVHGDADPTVPVEESRKMVKLGQDLGVKIKYIEVPGGDHSNIVVPNMNAVFDWFEAHRRQPRGAVKAAGGQK